MSTEVFRVTRDLPPFQGVAANSTARVELPIGRRYHSVDLAIGTLANVGEIRVIANGQTIQRYTAAQLNALNQFDGMTAAGATTSLLRIMFDRYDLLSAAFEMGTALNTAIADSAGVAITSLSVECDVGGTTTTISGTSETSFVDPSIGERRHWVRFRSTLVFAGIVTGENQLNDFPRQSQREIEIDQIALIPSANDISSFKVEKNNEIVSERSKALNERIQNDGGRRSPQSGYIVLDRTERGSGGNGIDLTDASDFRVRVTASGAMTATCIYDTLGYLQG